jgi:hypothetical protein
VPTDARARRSVGQFVRILFGRIDQIAETFVRGLGANRQSVRRRCDEGDRIKIFVGILFHVLKGDRRQNHAAKGIHQNTVPILG